MRIKIAETLISAKGISLSFGLQNVLDQADFSIQALDRIGLIGRNGSGKSTFLKVLIGNLQAQSGELMKKRGLRIGYLPQDLSFNQDISLRELLLQGAKESMELLKKYEAAQGSEKIIFKEELLKRNFFSFESKMSSIITELGIPYPEQHLSEFSGGEKRRALLAGAIINEPDLIILDEPTNHLDYESIDWIVRFLSGFQGACLFVTHDRYFLDRVSNKIAELYSGKFYFYKGNYSKYLEEKALRESIEEAGEQKRKGFLRKELEWVSRGPKARGTKQKSRLDRYYEELDNEPQGKQPDVELLLPKPERLGNKVLILKNLGAAYEGGFLFRGLDLNIEPGRKIGLVGRNGLGKTTLLKIIFGLRAPEEGLVERGENTVFNYVDQARLSLDDDNSVIEEIGEGSEYIFLGDEKIKVWSYLKRFCFTDDRINTRVSRLSGGERSRLLLAKILKQGGNFLLLDEPTNDLDLPTLRVLEEALMDFKGCLMIVSHDRYFLDRVTDSLLVFEGNSEVCYSEGDYEFYLKKKKLLKGVEKPNQQEVKPQRGQSKKKKMSYKETKELEEIEGKILDKEAEIKEIEDIFSDPDFYKTNSGKSKELTEALESAKKETEALYARWEELEELKNS